MRLGLFRVTGESMMPAYGEGDYVVTVHRRYRVFRVGAVVVVDHPRYGRIVKRVVESRPDGAVRLAGDNAAASASSTLLGTIERSRILGRVVWRVPRPARLSVSG